jgi:hypothetical protein
MTTMVTADRWRPAPAAMSYAATGAPRLPDLADVKGIVARTLSRAKALGRDEPTRTRAAALAVLAVRPDLSLSQALAGIARLQASGAI